MTTVCIDEKPKVGKVKKDAIPLDENGNPIGQLWEEVQAELDKRLSEMYGVDFVKIFQLLESGELDESELSDELLLRPEYKYEPYPGFKPKPPKKPDPQWLKAKAEEYELINAEGDDL